MYSSTLSLTSALDGVGWSLPHPGRFTPQERIGTHCVGGWVGSRGSLDRCGKSERGTNFFFTKNVKVITLVIK